MVIVIERKINIVIVIVMLIVILIVMVLVIVIVIVVLLGSVTCMKLPRVSILAHPQPAFCAGHEAHRCARRLHTGGLGTVLNQVPLAACSLFGLQICKFRPSRSGQPANVGLSDVALIPVSIPEWGRL